MCTDYNHQHSDMTLAQAYIIQALHNYYSVFHLFYISQKRSVAHLNQLSHCETLSTVMIFPVHQPLFQDPSVHLTNFNNSLCAHSADTFIHGDIMTAPAT